MPLVGRVASRRRASCWTSGWRSVRRRHDSIALDRRAVDRDLGRCCGRFLHVRPGNPVSSELVRPTARTSGQACSRAPIVAEVILVDLPLAARERSRCRRARRRTRPRDAGLAAGMPLSASGADPSRLAAAAGQDQRRSSQHEREAALQRARTCQIVIACADDRPRSCVNAPPPAAAPALFVPAADVLLELRAELADRVLDRPAGAVGQAADRRAGHDADRCRRPRRGSSSPPAAPGRGGSARAIFSIQPVPSRHGVHWPHDSWAKNRQMLYSTSTMLVCSSKTVTAAGAQAQAADLARAVEIERRVELGLGHEAHADAAGDAALGLAALPDAAAVLVDQLADGDAQRQLDAARAC